MLHIGSATLRRDLQSMGFVVPADAMKLLEKRPRVSEVAWG
jgi:hypothetical protein